MKGQKGMVKMGRRESGSWRCGSIWADAVDLLSLLAATTALPTAASHRATLATHRRYTTPGELVTAQVSYTQRGEKETADKRGSISMQPLLIMCQLYTFSVHMLINRHKDIGHSSHL